MSIKVVVRIMEEMDIPRPWASVLIAMGDHADDEGKHCFPSVDRIAWKANYKWRQVVNIIRDMEKAGLITTVAKATQQRPTEYQINFDAAPKKLAFDTWREANGRGAISQQPDQESVIQGCNLTTSGMQSHDTGVQSRNKKSRENAPEPSVEPSRETIKNQSADADGEAVSDRDSSNASDHEVKLQPFDLALAVLAEVGVDVGTLPGGAKGKQLAVAKRLIADGMTIQEGSAIAQWLLRDDFWRSKGIDMMTIESNRMKYIAAQSAKSVAPAANNTGGITIDGMFIPNAMVEKAKSTFAWSDVLQSGGMSHVTPEQIQRIVSGEKMRDVLDDATARWLNAQLIQHIRTVNAISYL